MDEYARTTGIASAISSRQPYAAIYTTLGCRPITARLLLHPGAVQGRRAGGRHQGVGQQLTSGARRRSSTRIDRLVNQHAASATSSSRTKMFVLNARHVLGICDLLIERDYGLNIWAYARVDTVKRRHARQAEARRVQLAGARHRSGRRARVLISVDKSYAIGEVHDTVAARQGMRASTSSATTSSACRGQRRHDAADPRSGARAELRVRDYYSAMAYPGLAALRAGAGPRMDAPREMERLLAARR